MLDVSGVTFLSFYKILVNHYLFISFSFPQKVCFFYLFSSPKPVHCHFDDYGHFPLFIYFSPSPEITKWGSLTIYLALLRTSDEREKFPHLMTFKKLFPEWNLLFNLLFLLLEIIKGGWRLLIRSLRILFIHH